MARAEQQLNHIASALAALDRAEAQSIERDLFLERLNNSFEKVLSRLDSGIDKILARVNKANTSTEGQLNGLITDLQELGDAVQRDNADESTGRDVADQRIFSEMSVLRSLVTDVIAAVAAIPTSHPPMPVMPEIPVTDLGSITSRLDEIVAKLDEPVIAEMTAPEVARPKRVYTIKVHPNGMPSMVVAEDQFDG